MANSTATTSTTATTTPTPTVSKFAKEFDDLYEKGIDRGLYGFARVMSIEYEEDNMRNLCKLIRKIDSPTEVSERLENLSMLSVDEVIDTAFFLLKKFPNNPYLQINCVTIIYIALFENDNNICIPTENYGQYITILLEAIRIVKTCITIDDENITDGTLRSFTSNCIAILHKLNVKDHKNNAELSELTLMYNKYVEFDEELHKIYKEIVSV